MHANIVPMGEEGLRRPEHDRKLSFVGGGCYLTGIECLARIVDGCCFCAAIVWLVRVVSTACGCHHAHAHVCVHVLGGKCVGLRSPRVCTVEARSRRAEAQARGVGPRRADCGGGVRWPQRVMRTGGLGAKRAAGVLLILPQNATHAVGTGM